MIRIVTTSMILGILSICGNAVQLLMTAAAMTEVITNEAESSSLHRICTDFMLTLYTKDNTLGPVTRHSATDAAVP